MITVVIEGDCGGGEREFRVRLDESDKVLFRVGYEEMGWGFANLIPQLTELIEALGAEVDDQTT